MASSLKTCLELLASISDAELEPWYDDPYVAEYTRNELQELLSTGNAAARDADGYSALYHARFCPQLLQALLAAGLTPSTCCEEEVAALLDIYLPLSTIRLMLEAGAPPNVKDSDFGTPLHYACDADDVERVRLLLVHGADPNAPSWDEQTTLFYAKSPEVAELLLAAGADANAENIDCYRPIHEANAAVTRVLLEHGAEVQHTQLYGVTALALTEDEEKIKLLLKAGARPISRDIDYAVRHLPQQRLEAWLTLCGDNRDTASRRKK